MTKSLSFAVLLCSLFSILCMVSCSHEHDRDLKAYIHSIKSRPAGPVEPIPHVIDIQSFAYPEVERRNPFKPMLTQTRDDTKLAPDQTRIKENLELFPLDSLNFVGSIKRDEQNWALMSAPDGVVHRVRLDNYLGKHYGQVKKITKDKIFLSETVRGPDGWFKRETIINLKE